MEKILEAIATLTEPELQQAMQAIALRYRRDFPDQDVIFIALHKDPELRRQELADTLRLIQGCTQWQSEQLQQGPVS